MVELKLVVDLSARGRKRSKMTRTQLGRERGLSLMNLTHPIEGH